MFLTCIDYNALVATKKNPISPYFLPIEMWLAHHWYLPPVASWLWNGSTDSLVCGAMVGLAVKEKDILIKTEDN